MPDLLVVQWSRLGDLLHTRPLLTAAKAAGRRIMLAVDERYLPVACLFSEVDVVLPVPLAKWSGLARHAASQAELIHELLDRAVLRAQPASRALVLSRSRAAISFAEACHPAELIGFRSSSGAIQASPELEWIERSMREARPPAVHLADVWRTMVDLDPVEVPPAPSRHLANGARSVAVICDAGDPERSIPREWLAQLCSRLAASRSIRLWLVGTLPGSEADKLAQLTTANSSIMDVRGQTSLAQLIELLQSTDIVVGPDTGALQLAAELGCRCVGLFHANAIPNYTAPYRAGCAVARVFAWSAVLLEAVAEAASSFTVQADAAGRSAAEWWTTGFDSHGLILLPAGSPDPHDALRQIERAEFFARFGRGRMTARTASANRQESLSIVIPECDATHYTDALLVQLSALPPELAVEVCVVSSGPLARAGSPAGTGGVRWMKSLTPLTFAQACNLGARSASGYYLLFLNNDVELNPDSIRALFAARDPHALISPVVRYPDRTVQNCGVEIADAVVTEIAHGRPDVPRPLPVPDAVSGIALLVQRDVFARLSGFDETYVNGYEDLDFCLRARESGIPSRCVADAELIHFRSSSPGRFTAEGRNLAQFVSRWNGGTQPGAARRPRQLQASARIVIFSDLAAESAGAQTRWILPLTALELTRGHDYAWVDTTALGSAEAMDLARAAESVIVFRPMANTDIVDSLVDGVRHSGGTLIVDSDDLILQRFESESLRGRHRAEWETAFLRLLRAADVVTVSTDELHQRLRRQEINAEVRFSWPPVPLVPPPRAPRRQRESVRIGLISGPVHGIDIASIVPALEQTIERHSECMLYFWGARPGPLAYHPRVRMGGPVLNDYAQHLQRLADFELDIVCVPLLDSPANRVRTPLKFYECALIGSAAACSDVVPYRTAVTTGETGLLVSDRTHDWIAALERLILGRDQREAMAATAYRHTLAVYEQVSARDSLHGLLNAPRRRAKQTPSCVGAVER